jgi:hypothetical protein
LITPPGPPGENYTHMYRVKVIDEYISPIADAYVEIKRYINTTGIYEIISSFYTDGYGEGDSWLLPSTHYKIFITKTGYNPVIGTDWLTDPIFYGANYPKIFQMTTIISGTQNTVLYNITWDISPTLTSFTTGFIVYYNITSLDNTLIWYAANVSSYNSTTRVWTNLYTSNITDITGGSIQYDVPNITGTYGFSCSFRKTGYSSYMFPIRIYTIMFYNASANNLDTLITKIVGHSPVFIVTPSGEVIVSWAALIASFAAIFVFFTFSPKFAGLAVMAVGAVLGIFKSPLGIIQNDVLNWMACGVIIILGLLLIIESNKET